MDNEIFQQVFLIKLHKNIIKHGRGVNCNSLPPSNQDPNKMGVEDISPQESEHRNVVSCL